jgi:hypothetical protein
LKITEMTGCDVGEDVRRHATDAHEPDDDHEQRGDDERVGAPEREPDDPHG